MHRDKMHRRRAAIGWGAAIGALIWLAGCVNGGDSSAASGHDRGGGFYGGMTAGPFQP